MPISIAGQSVASFYNYPMMAAIDYFKPEVVNMKYKQHGDQFLPLFMILRSMGRETMISADSWFGFEDQEIHTTIHSLNGFADPGVGVSTTLTVDVSTGDVDAYGHTYLRDGDILRMSNGNNAFVSAKTVVSPTQFTFTITPFGSNSLGAVIAGQELSITSGASADGTGPVEPATRYSYRKDFYLQTIKEHVAIEGGVLADQVWPKYLEDGKTIVGVYSEAFDDLQYRLNLKINGAHWTGQTNTGVSPITQLGGAGFQNTVYTTGGLIPDAALYGLNFHHSGAFPITNFDTITTYLTQQRVQSEYMMMMYGVGLGNLINNSMYQANLNTQVDYTMMAKSLYGGDEGLAMSINFTQYTHNTGYKFIFRRMDDFSNPTTFGLPVYGFTNTGLIMPINKFRDAESGKTQNNIEFRYKGLGKYSRRFRIWTISGAGEQDQFLSANDWSDTYAQASTGLQSFKANQMVLMQY